MLQEEAAPIQLVLTLLQLQFPQRHNMLYDEFNHLVSNSISGGFKENLSPPYMMRKNVMYRKRDILIFLMKIVISMLKITVCHYVFPHLNIRNKD